MDQPQYTTRTEALQSVPDPRHVRGKRYPWLFLLTLIALALTLSVWALWQARATKTAPAQVVERSE